MLRYLFDRANAITASGLVLTIISLNLIMAQRIDIAIVVLMWAVMLDHIDGWVARRARNRAPEFGQFGGDLDSLTDFVSAGIAPWLILVKSGAGTLPLLLVSLLLLFSAGLRVAYFNNFGLKSDGRFYGVPLTYNVPLVGVVLMIHKFWPGLDLSLVLPWLLGGLAVLHVAPFGPPPVRGIGFLIVTLYSLLLSAVMLA
jgi:CDP-diacylglycerol--serine O-phosphatidyltransferase